MVQTAASSLKDQKSAPQSSQHNFKWWQLSRTDIAWVLTIYGTAIGAGLLFLPIQVGIYGFLSFLIIAVVMIPTTYHTSKKFSKVILEGGQEGKDFTHIAHKFMGKSVGNVVIVCYFLSTLCLLLIYSIAFTNTINVILANQLNIHLYRPFLVFLTIGGLCLLASVGRHSVIKFISILVIPFMLSLLFFSFSLIPHWSFPPQEALLASAAQTFGNVNEHTPNFLQIILAITPLAIISFSFVPVISPLVVYAKESCPENPAKKANQLIFVGSGLIILTALLFLVSCILTLAYPDFMQAKKDNISVLDYLSIALNRPYIKYLALILGFVAVSKAFLANFLGAREVAFRIISHKLNFKGSENAVHRKVDSIFLLIFFVLSSICAILNLNIINNLDIVIAPAITTLNFLFPIILFYTVPQLRKCRSLTSDICLSIIGITSLSASIYHMLY